MDLPTDPGYLQTPYGLFNGGNHSAPRFLFNHLLKYAQRRISKNLLEVLKKWREVE
jgi:hypothetical protein